MKRSITSDSDDSSSPRKQTLSITGSSVDEYIDYSDDVDDLHEVLQDFLDVNTIESNRSSPNSFSLGSSKSSNGEDNESTEDSGSGKKKTTRRARKSKTEKKVNLNVMKNMDLLNSIEDPEERKRLIIKLKRRKEFPRIVKTDLRWSLPQMWINTLNRLDVTAIGGFIDNFCHGERCEHIYSRVAGFHDPLNARVVGRRDIAEEVFIRTSRAPDMMAEVTGCRIRRSKELQGAVIEADIRAKFTKLFEAVPSSTRLTTTSGIVLPQILNNTNEQPMDIADNSSDTKTNSNQTAVHVKDEKDATQSGSSMTSLFTSPIRYLREKFASFGKSKGSKTAATSNLPSSSSIISTTSDVKVGKQLIAYYTDEVTDERLAALQLTALSKQFPNLPLLLGSPMLCNKSSVDRIKFLKQKFRSIYPAQVILEDVEQNDTSMQTDDTSSDKLPDQLVIKKNSDEKLDTEEELTKKKFNIVMMQDPMNIELLAKLYITVDEDNRIVRFELVDQLANISEGGKQVVLPHSPI